MQIGQVVVELGQLVDPQMWQGRFVMVRLVGCLSTFQSCEERLLRVAQRLRAFSEDRVAALVGHIHTTDPLSAPSLLRALRLGRCSSRGLA